MMIKDTKELGNAIKNARKAQGLTQAQLAAVCNVGVRFIVDLENGKETAQMGKALKVAVSLGIKLEIEKPYKGDE